MSALSWVILFLLVAVAVNFCLLMVIALNLNRALRLIHTELGSQRERVRSLETRR